MTLLLFEITYCARTFRKNCQHIHPSERIGDVNAIGILSCDACVISDMLTRDGAGTCIAAFALSGADLCCLRHAAVASRFSTFFYIPGS